MKKMVLGLIAILATVLAAQSAFADKIVMLEGTKESLEARKDLISTAESEIRAQYYIIEDDNVANSGLAILRDVAIKKPYVRVRIIVDSLSNAMLLETMAAFLSNDQGHPLPNVEIREYNAFKWYAPWRYTKRMHDKALIVDNDALISGGRNIANGYYGLKNKKDLDHSVFEDTDILVLESPAIREASDYFDSLWNSKFVKDVKLGKMSFARLKSDACEEERNRVNDHNSEQDYRSCEHFRKKNLNLVNKQRAELGRLAATYKSNTTKSAALDKWLSDKNILEVDSIDYIFDNPVGQKSSLKKPEALEDNMAKQLYQAIRSAQKSVVIVAPYFVVTPEQEQLFKELRARNIRVRVFTNGKNSNEVPLAHIGYMDTRDLALNQGVQIWEYNGPDTLHAKMVLIDRNKMYIGSFNWDFRSQNLNRENGIIAHVNNENQINAKETDIFAKIARIYQRSTRVGDTQHLNPDIGDDGQFDNDDISKLAKQNKNGNNDLFWRIIYPLVKKQI